MKNKQLAKIFGKAIRYEFILLIVLGICAVWSEPTNYMDDLGTWGKLVITDLILLVASVIFFVIYDSTKDKED